MKRHLYITIAVLLYLPIHLHSQSTMNIHMNDGSVESFFVNDIDSITYDNNTPTNYSIGDEGPAGGYVVYDKGSYSDGWRYIELSPDDLNSSEAADCGVGGSLIMSGIGYGMNNTQVLIDECGSVPTDASTICYNYLLVHDGVTYDDWYLPNIEELTLIYNVFVSLNKPSWGIQHQSNFWLYWSSSEIDSYQSYALRFSDGNVIIELNDNTNYVRAIRYF